MMLLKSKPSLHLQSLVLVACCASSIATATDWLQWRGPSGQNYAVGDNEGLPVTWSETKNVIWRSKVPGHGHSTPILVGDRIFLTTADEANEQNVALCYDRNTGEQQWAKILHDGNFTARIHKKNTHASPTPASDGESVFVTFHVGDEIKLTSLDLDGEVRWETTVGPYDDQYNFGYGASPTIHDGKVIVVAEHKKAGYIAAFSTSDGSEVWRSPVYDSTSYSSPIVALAGDREQLVLSGNRALTAWNPADGARLWQIEIGTLATCGTVVWDSERLFFSGGFPRKETAAVAADGSRVIWSNKRKAYEQSMLVVDGHVYCVDEGGIAYCWRAEDGAELWRGRLDGGGPISASPILVNGLIYVSMERGQSFVFRADPSKFEEVASNYLGDAAFASPVIADGRLFLRVGVTEGADRQEWLYCIGQ